MRYWLLLLLAAPCFAGMSYPIVDTGQSRCYDNYREIMRPAPGAAFYGQDAQVQGNQPAYKDNGNGMVTDRATGLMWAKADSGTGMNWQQALAWVQGKNAANYLGHNDWRLPNAKELQSIVDYTRSPDTTKSAAIDPVFICTPITNEGGAADYPFYWTGTSHLDGPPNQANAAIYLSFGRALGWMGMPPGSPNVRLLDVHGAGAQRSDPKAGNPAGFPRGRGPQGDVIRIFNYVRIVRDTK
ncbi:MAG: Lcl C-terminal domain-containing protein [Armatimonadota bacterium]